MTKIPFNTATIDTDSAVDTTNNRFTVPSGKGGKYNISYSIGEFQTVLQLFIEYLPNYIKMVLIPVYFQQLQTQANYGWAFSAGGSGVIDLNAGDYIEVYAYISTGNTAGITASRTWLSGFRIGA